MRKRLAFVIRLLAIALCVLAFLPTASRARAIHWSPNAVSGDWYTAENWIPQTVPNGPNDRAIFDPSTLSDISFPALSKARVDRMVFSEGDFSIDVSTGSSVTLDGAGILGPVFVTVSGKLRFLNYAANYSSVGFIVYGGNPGGVVRFDGHSSSAPIDRRTLPHSRSIVGE